MKKRLLSLLMALCLMLTLVPAAFAVEDQPDTVTLSNGRTVVVPEVTIAEEPDATPQSYTLTTYGGTGTRDDPYTVSTAKALYDLGHDKFSSSTVRYSYVEITDDINFGDSNVPAINEWNGFFTFFYGEIKGLNVTKTVTSEDGVTQITQTRPAQIKGLPTNRFLIYYLCGGVIENLTIDPNGNAGTLTYYPVAIGGKYFDFTVRDVTVDSTQPIVLSGGDNQANYSPFVFAAGGKFTMENCTNKVNISGNTYGSVFYGYYPMDKTGTYTFTNCVNTGIISLRHAGMFFGNNSKFYDNHQEYALSSGRITFSGCKNAGEIYGTQSASIFAARPAGEPDTISDAYDQHFEDNPGTVNIKEGKYGLTGQGLNMKLFYDNAGNLTMTPNTAILTSGKTVDKYRVSVYSYVGWYVMDKNSGELVPDGSNRFGTFEELINGNTTITLKAYGVCDYPRRTEGLTFDTQTICGLSVANYNGQKYYWINSSKPALSQEFDWYYLVGTPGLPAAKDFPDIVTLSAYDSHGMLLGTVSATPVSNDTEE